MCDCLLQGIVESDSASYHIHVYMEVSECWIFSNKQQIPIEQDLWGLKGGELNRKSECSDSNLYRHL